MTRSAKWSAAGVLLAAAVWLPVPRTARRPRRCVYTPPRTAFGHPDLQGVWQVLNTAAWDIQDHSASLGVPAGKGVVEGNEIPYQPSALEKKKQNYENRAKLDPEARCLLSGVPRITYMPYPFQIVQQADKVNILYEYNHTLRHIYMNGNPHPEGPIEWWMGDSRGRWEGNTLVVDTVHFTAETWLDRAGNFHSEELHVVERFTPHRSRPHAVRGDDRGSEGVHAALEDEHAALPARRIGRRAAGIRVLRLLDRGKLAA